MAREIHPNLSALSIKCSGCSNTFQLFTTMKQESMDVEVCYNCHPAYTGKRRASTTGRVEAFNNKYAGFSFTRKKPSDSADAKNS
ncbi:50S ribosomal protein L31 [Candidatus Synchoanobacter obligatus]|uniref:50S ribosomal protein L31 n=1 Tax=Candidatus Synchoanobacter obligatus TaxID=2919597 RepID=A0ABT1L7U7_9GAMM|nr:50S ribosomal protein L31 [Candidatus Synchoanobacter obligatus]MCP8352620.1 50S ribosomal protein L31 [Candidatus Synchoanobacter obligatus]